MPCSRDSMAGTLEWKTLSLLNSESGDSITIQRWHTWIKGKHTPVWKCLPSFHMLLTKIKMKWCQKTVINKHEMKLPTGNHMKIQMLELAPWVRCPRCRVWMWFISQSSPKDRCGSTRRNPWILSKETGHPVNDGISKPGVHSSKQECLKWGVKVRSATCDYLKATYMLCCACVCTLTDRFSLRSTVSLKT